MSEALFNSVNFFKNICRICLQRNTTLQNIFSLSLNTIIIQCTTVQISIDDGLPQMVCENCFILAKQAIQFKMQCENSDRILRKMVNDLFIDNRINEISEDPLYIDQSKISLKNDTVTSECIDIKLENNSESLENSNANEVFQGAEVETVVIKTEVAQDLEIINQSGLNGDCSKPLRKRKKKQRKRYNCIKCTKYFQKQKDFSKHMDETHGEHRFKCDTCPRSFNYKVLLKSHMKMHIGDKPFSCSICDKRFITKTGMENHSWMHKTKEEWPFLCSVCGKRAVNESRLNRHMDTVHQEIGNYQCEYCSKIYPTQCSLKDHVRIHTGVRKVVCSVCGKQLASPSSFNKHMRLHKKESENERRYNCTYCSKKFYTADVLRRHIFIHTGEKRYICTVCKKAFNQSSTLKTHMWVHKGGYPFQCDVCGQRFRRNNFLLEHKKKRHQEIPFALDDNK